MNLHRLNNNLSIFLLPFFLFIIGIVITFSIFRVVRSQQQQLLIQEVSSEAKIIHNQIITHMDYRIHALKRMAHRWEQQGGSPRASWERDAQAYIDDQPGYQALEWVDTTYHVRWIVPLKGNESAQDLDLTFEKKRAKALQQARDRREIMYSGVVDLVQGKKGLLVYFPLIVDGQFDGFLLAVFDIAAFLNYALSGHLPQRYSVSIFEEQQNIFSKYVLSGQDSPGALLSEWTQTLEIPLLTLNWAVQVTPYQGLLAPQAYVHYVIVVSGLVFSFLSAVVGYFIHLSHRRAQTIVDSEERFRQIVNNAPIGIAVVGSNGQWRQVNQALCNLVGYREEELLGSDIQALTHPDDMDEDRRMRRSLYDGEIPSYEMETRFFHKDGGMIRILLTVGAVRDQARTPQYYVLQIMDITARKTAEEQLESARAFQELMINAIPDLVFVKDQELRIVQANRAFLSLYPEDKRDDVIGTTTLEDYDPEEMKLFVEKDHYAFQQGYSETEEKIQFPNGSTRVLFTKKTRFSGDEKYFLLCIFSQYYGT